MLIHNCVELAGELRLLPSVGDEGRQRRLRESSLAAQCGFNGALVFLSLALLNWSFLLEAQFMCVELQQCCKGKRYNKQWLLVLHRCFL